MSAYSQASNKTSSHVEDVIFHGRRNECSTTQGLIGEAVPQLGETRKGTYVKTPDTVKLVTRQKNNLFAIKSLINSKNPRQIFMRRE